MPAKSQSQRALIFGKRSRYGSKAKTPKKWKWIWHSGWENTGSLPEEKITALLIKDVINEAYNEAKED